MSDWYSQIPRVGEANTRKRTPFRRWLLRFVVVVGFFAFVAGVVTFVLRGAEWLQAHSTTTTVTQTVATVQVQITPGMSATQIGRLLEEKGVVDSASEFVGLVKSRQSENKLQPGTYRLRTDLSLVTVVQKLETGEGSSTFRVTIPEGLTVSQIGALLDKGGKIKGEDYVGLSKEPSKFVMPKVGGSAVEVDTLEGLLFPDTYYLLQGDGATQLIGAQLAAFEKKTSSLSWSKAEALGRTPYEIVIVASLAEKEAVTREDRAKVAAVIYNRLQQKMALGLDVTVRYALDKWTGDLTAEDLKVDSPYNTRVVKGLPPTPIANPGLDALRAALEPAEVDYLYFIADKDGKLFFTADYEEFLALKKKFWGE